MNTKVEQDISCESSKKPIAGATITYELVNPYKGGATKGDIGELIFEFIRENKQKLKKFKKVTFNLTDADLEWWDK